MRKLGPVCVTGIAGVLMLTSVGHASADGFEGQTYGDAAGAVSDWGGTPVVASVTGNQLELDECIVISSKASHATDGLGQKTGGEYLFYLNCNASVASGKPGNSAQSAEGQKAKKDQTTAEWLQTKLDEDPGYCDDKAWCVSICERTGLCEVPT